MASIKSPKTYCSFRLKSYADRKEKRDAPARPPAFFAPTNPAGEWLAKSVKKLKKIKNKKGEKEKF